MLIGLTQHPGWALYQEFMRAEENHFFVQLQGVETGDMAMKVAGTYMGIKRARELVEMYIRQAQAFSTK